MTDITIASRPNNITLNRERILLIIGSIFIFINCLALAIQNPVDWRVWLMLIVWLICAFVGHQLLERYLPQRDALLYPIVMIMSGWGLVLIKRLAPPFADRQTLWLVIATGAMLTVALAPHSIRWLKQYRYTILVTGLILLVSTIVLGRNPSGAVGAPELWLGIGSVYFQPSEALKVILVAFLASYLSEQYPALRAETKLKNQEKRFSWLTPRIVGPIILMWSLSVVIVVWQRDLGTAALFFAVFLILLYVASGEIFIMLGGGVLLLLAGFAAYQLFSVVALRVDIWINPWLEADGRAYQIVQSLMAFGAGGILGDGIGQGTPIYIPVVHSDFVFSAIAEEFGLLGIITVIVLILVFVLRGLRIAIAHHGRPFYALLAIGLSMLIGIQTLLIMGGVLKLLPLTGVTLPYMSYGGSSLLMSFVIAGLLLRLSAEAQ